MDIKKAKNVVEMLSEGLNPKNGQPVPGDSPILDPMVKEALCTILKNVRIPIKKSRVSVEQKQAENIEKTADLTTPVLPWTVESRTELAQHV